MGRKKSVELVRVAVVQTSPSLDSREKNVDDVIDFLTEAVSHGAKLVVFPECALSGYLITDADEVRRLAEPVPGPVTRRISEMCARLQAFAVVGLIECSKDAIYNSAVFIGPNGITGLYRKTHLPGLGLDRLVSHGNTPFTVYETSIGRIGMLICYDLRFPESVRILALQGAEIIAVPTNWPAVGGESASSSIPEILTRARACENHVYLAVADRVGKERGWASIGRSQLVDVFGRVVAEGDSHSRQILYADFDLALARQKDFVYVPDRFETHWFKDRRVDMYGKLLDSKVWPLTALRTQPVEEKVRRASTHGAEVSN